MMSITRRTSITSMSGVVFMSTITSWSPPGCPTFIAMGFQSSMLLHIIARLGDEADLLNARLLHGQNHLANGLEAGFSVAANMHFRRLPTLRKRGLQCRHKARAQLAHINGGIVPVDVSILVHRDGDIFR